MDRARQDALYAEASASNAAAIRRLARGYEADPDRQRDLLQEIYLELWLSLGSFDGRCSLRTWVYRIAHNVGASHDRQVILLYLEGEPAVSIAEVTGITTGNVATKIHRIKRLLKQKYLEGATDVRPR